MPKQNANPVRDEGFGHGSGEGFVRCQAMFALVIKVGPNGEGEGEGGNERVGPPSSEK